MRTNYVLIDFESVQPESLAPLAGDHFKVVVFVGASQAKLPFEVAASIQRLGSHAEYVKVSGHGHNALDFHIAYYIGKLAAADATPYFHIISNDSGFDPLIQHLKSQGVFARRVKSIAEIPLVRATTAKSPAERLAVALDWLQQTKASKPRTVKTLSSSIGSLFQKQLSVEEVIAIVQQLCKHGHLSVVGTKVTYHTVTPTNPSARR
jgi:PIN domain